MVSFKKVILPLFFIGALAFQAAAQDGPRPMSVVDFLNIPGLSDAEISPDGEQVLYLLAESDWEANRQIGHIWRIDANGEDNRRLTFGEKGESAPGWSPDGEWIAFLANRGDSEGNQLFLLPNDGGEARPLTEHATGISSFEWAPDGQSIYFLADDTLSAEKQEQLKLKDDVYALDENYQQRHLWRITLEDKSETRLTDGDFSILSFDLSPEGNKIVAHRGPNPLYDDYFKSEIWVMNADGSGARQLTDNNIGERNARLSPDGSQVLFLAFANEDLEFYYNPKLFLLPADGSGQPMVPMKGLPYEISEAQWSFDGRSIYFVANMGAEEQLWRYDLANGERSQITQGEHSLNLWTYQPETGKHIVAINTMQNPGDLFWLETEGPEQLTHPYDYLQERYKVPRPELVRWKGEEGVTIEGLLYYPVGYEEGRRYPLVVQTHGGPASSDHFGLSRSFTRYNPVLCGQGYAVLQPNYRGSTGYGDNFLRDMIGGYFRQSHLDVMAGVDYLIEQGIADPDRMVKMGWSAGGHMTNKIITFTDRFKAASSGAGAVNWIGMYAQSDIRTYRTPWFGGSPWQEKAPIEVYWEHSPLKYIANVSTPTLVIVGENDPRVPMPQSVELFRALRSQDVPTHLYVAPREPHGWNELRHRLFKINVELEWFAKYALGEEYEWEKVKKKMD